MTTKADLDALDALHAKATDGEWREHDPFVLVPDYRRHQAFAYVGDDFGLVATDMRECDKAAIVALHNAYPALAAELRRARKIEAGVALDALIAAVLEECATKAETPIYMRIHGDPDALAASGITSMSDALMGARILLAVEKEREACAVLLMTVADEHKAAARDVEPSERPLYREAAMALAVGAARIRARGER